VLALREEERGERREERGERREERRSIRPLVYMSPRFAIGFLINFQLGVLFF
jgi:hypothetical protein